MRNAIAQIARHRWPTNGIKQVQACWGLSEGAARNLYYGNASGNALDECLHHPRNGGWLLHLELGAIMFAQSVDQFAAQEIERLEDEHTKSVASNRRLLEVVRGRPALGLVDADSPVRLGGQPNRDVGHDTGESPPRR